MATEKDLINAVKESLRASGELGRIKAEMRTEVIKLLDKSSGKGNSKIPNPPKDVLLMNELIREYLDWMGYKYSSTVFCSECDLSKRPLDRSLLIQGLQIKDLKVEESEDSQPLPLLCTLIEAAKNRTT